jgi:molybdate transport system substrate-binding protein
MKTLIPLAIAMFAGSAAAAEITVLSAGAVEPGLYAFSEIAKRETGHTLVVRFNTGPQIANRLAKSEVFDILISPPPALAQAQKDGQIAADTKTPVGRVGAGVVVKAGAPLPDVSSVDALKRAILAADAIVYNTASTGIYLDKLFAQLGILDAIKPKTTRYPDGASVMEHVIRGNGSEIGFGAITEIRQFEPKGIEARRAATRRRAELHGLRSRRDDGRAERRCGARRAARSRVACRTRGVRVRRRRVAFARGHFPATGAGGNGSGHPVLHHRDRAEVAEDRLEVVVGEVAVHPDRHRRQDLAPAPVMAAAADRVGEVALRPPAEPGLGIGRQVRGEAHAPRTRPRGVGRRAGHDPRLVGVFAGDVTLKSCG